MITRYLVMSCFSLSLGFSAYPAYAVDPAQPKANETTQKPATDKATAIEDETGMCFKGTNCDGEKIGVKTISDCKTASGNSWYGHAMIGGHDRCISSDIDNLDWRQ